MMWEQQQAEAGTGVARVHSCAHFSTSLLQGNVHAAIAVWSCCDGAGAAKDDLAFWCQAGQLDLQPGLQSKGNCAAVYRERCRCSMPSTPAAADSQRWLLSPSTAHTQSHAGSAAGRHLLEKNKLLLAEAKILVLCKVLARCGICGGAGHDVPPDGGPAAKCTDWWIRSPSRSTNLWQAT